MGGVPKKHHSHGKTRRRRSHLSLTRQKLAVCPNCRMPVLPHRACVNCGAYTRKTRDKNKSESPGA